MPLSFSLLLAALTNGWRMWRRRKRSIPAGSSLSSKRYSRLFGLLSSLFLMGRLRHHQCDRERRRRRRNRTSMRDRAEAHNNNIESKDVCGFASHIEDAKVCHFDFAKAKNFSNSGRKSPLAGLRVVVNQLVHSSQPVFFPSPPHSFPSSSSVQEPFSTSSFALDSPGGPKLDFPS